MTLPVVWTLELTPNLLMSDGAKTRAGEERAMIKRRMKIPRITMMNESFFIIRQEKGLN
jgi:hypothetical protein